MSTPLTPEQQDYLVKVIREAEQHTSGEIRIHLEPHCPVADPVDRAADVFAHLEMHKTKYRNGVLFYMAYTDRKFAIFGDEGIHQKVTGDFWESTRNLMRHHLSVNHYTEALGLGIEQAAQQLARYFPYDALDDTNELPNDISIDLID